MKPLHFFLFSLLLIVSTDLFSQAPLGINYQGLLRDDGGLPVMEKNIAVKFLVLSDSPTGTVQYSEKQLGFTNQFGLFDMVIGQGEVLFGSFSDINWGAAPHFLRIEVDPNGLNDFQLLGTQQMVSVPYALYAEKSGSSGSLSYQAGDGIAINADTISNTGDADPFDDLTTSTYFDGDLTGYYYNLQIKNDVISSNKIANGTIKAEDLGSMGAASGQVLKYNGAAWTPGTDQSANYSPGNGISLSNNVISSTTWQQGLFSIYYTGGDVGIGTSNPTADLTVNQTILGSNSSGNLYTLNETSEGGGFLGTYGVNGNLNFAVSTLLGYPNHGYAAVKDASGANKAGMYVASNGTGYLFADGASGGVKNFRMPHPTNPDLLICYASIEGPEAAAYCRGTGSLTDGKGMVIFKEDFTIVANESTITVMLTPLSGDSKGLAVVEKNASGFVVKELLGGTGNYQFDWEVKAVRSGHENYEVLQPKKDSMPVGVKK